MIKPMISVLALLVIALAASSAEAGRMFGDNGEHSGWICSRGLHNQQIIRAGVQGQWSSRNDGICKRTCKTSRTYPSYKRGNWAIFTDTGLMCCCSVRNLPIYKFRNYHEQTPYASPEMRQRLGIAGGILY